MLAGALAPTDPVLAGDIGVAPPGNEEAEERGLPHGRFTLTTEAGLNDGFAYPLFLIGALVATEGGGRLAGPLGGGGSDPWSPTVDDGPTDDGQANEALIHDRDRRLGVSTSDKRQKRADIPNPKVLLGVNSWESGRTVQTRLRRSIHWSGCSPCARRRVTWRSALTGSRSAA